MIRFKTRYGGPRGNFRPGEVKSLSEKEEAALIRGGFAEAVEEEKEPKPEKKKIERPETATVSAPEQATAPPTRRRRKTEE